MSNILTVSIDLGERSYDVRIGEGALEASLDTLKTLCPRGRALIAADSAALNHHRTRLLDAFKAIDVTPVIFEIAGGEQAKTWDGLSKLVDDLLEANMERGEALIAFGGGTIGDLAGFASAVTKRGTNFVQIPTTLLAQVDSSVGGKTGINTKAGKNLAGAFHQPSLVIADTRFLATLPDREIRAGYAEIAKAGLIDDPDLFARLESAGAKALEGETLTQAIADAVAFKARIVAEDEKEGGVRALLNLGHTFGHAFEAEAKKGELVHGEAVSAGMVLAFKYSNRLGVCDAEAGHRAAEHLQAVGLPTRPHQLAGGPFNAEALVERMKSDKKNSGGSITLILAKGVGKAYIAKGADISDLTRFLTEELATP